MRGTLAQPRRVSGGAVCCAISRCRCIAWALAAVCGFPGCGPTHERIAPVEQTAAEEQPLSTIVPSTGELENVPQASDRSAVAIGQSVESLGARYGDPTKFMTQTARQQGKSVQSVQQDFDKLIEAGQFEEVHGLLRDALRERRDDPQLLYLTAVAHFAEGHPYRAEPVLNRVLQLDPQHAAARKLLCSVLTADGRCTAAIVQIDQLIARDTGDAEAYVLRAAARLRCRDLTAAEQDATSALEIDRATPDALVVRCVARLRAGSIDAATEDLEAARRGGASEKQLQFLESELAGARR